MENLNKQKQNNIVKKCTNSTLNVISYIIAIFFILSGLLYFNKIPAPSILIIIAGILMMPLVSNKLIKDKQYKIIKNLIIIILFLAFCVNVPIEENNNEVIQSTPTFSEGNYLGQFSKNKRSGTGSFTWNDGTIYNGSWYEDKISGKGKMTFINKDEYDGDFKDNKRDGTGKYTFKNGDVYEGSFKNDSMEGEGKYTFKNGDVYEGTFKNNKFNGNGTYTKNGKKYTGTWTDNKYSK